MVADIEHVVVYERIDEAIPGFEEVMPKSTTRIINNDDGHMMITQNDGEHAVCICLDQKMLAVIASYVIAGTAGRA